MFYEVAWVFGLANVGCCCTSFCCFRLFFSSPVCISTIRTERVFSLIFRNSQPHILFIDCFLLAPKHVIVAFSSSTLGSSVVSSLFVVFFPNSRSIHSIFVQKSTSGYFPLSYFFYSCWLLLLASSFFLLYVRARTKCNWHTPSNLNIYILDLRSLHRTDIIIMYACNMHVM